MCLLKNFRSLSRPIKVLSNVLSREIDKRNCIIIMWHDNDTALPMVGVLAKCYGRIRLVTYLLNMICLKLRILCQILNIIAFRIILTHFLRQKHQMELLWVSYQLYSPFKLWRKPNKGGGDGCFLIVIRLLLLYTSGPLSLFA